MGSNPTFGTTWHLRRGSYTDRMQVRRVRPDEWQALRELRLRALTSDPDAFGETIERAIGLADAEWQSRADSSDRPTFVAEAADGTKRLVAMAMGGPVREQPGTAGLGGMWVAPEARGQGIGAALIDAVETWARAAGYRSIGLGVTTSNSPAIRLYTKVGYADIGERHPLREAGGLEIAIMAKPL